MDDPHLGHAGEQRVVDVPLQPGQRLVHALPEQLQLQRHLALAHRRRDAGRRAAHVRLLRRRGRRGRGPRRGQRPQLFDRHGEDRLAEQRLHAPPADRAHDPGLVQRGDEDLLPRLRRPAGRRRRVLLRRGLGDVLRAQLLLAPRAVPLHRAAVLRLRQLVEHAPRVGAERLHQLLDAPLPLRAPPLLRLAVLRRALRGLAVQLAPPRDQCGPLGLQVRGEGADRVEHPRRLGAGRIEPPPRVLDDRRVEPELRGHRQADRRAGDAGDELVGRLERGVVEVARRVERPRRAVGPGLDRGVVRRRHDQRALGHQPLQRGRAEGRALRRIGPGADLVEQRQRALPRAVDHPREVLHVAGEGRERPLDRLLVADVGVEPLGERHARLGRRQRQPGVGHQRQQSDRLQRHRLAAGVRPGDHEHPLLAGEVHVERHDGARRVLRGERALQRRMARPDEAQADPRRDVRPAGARRLRPVGRRLEQVEPPEQVGRARDLLAPVAQRLGVLAQDPLDLLPLLLAQQGELVVHLDRLHRLDEEGLQRIALGVDDPRQAPRRVGPDRHDEAVVALRDVAVAQDVLRPLRLEQPGEDRLHLLLQPADLGPRARQLGAGVVGEQPVRAEVVDDRIDHRRDVGQRPRLGDELGEEGRIERLDRLRRAARDREHVDRLVDRAAVELLPRDLQRLEREPRIGDLGDRQPAGARPRGAHLGDQLLRPLDRAGVGQRPQRPREADAHRRPRAGGEEGADPLPLQAFEDGPLSAHRRSPAPPAPLGRGASPGSGAPPRARRPKGPRPRERRG